ncbi:uncharacterized protein [Diadema setosum]|uniref:uncharacterized protein n=1 Tax=Diadema setosum TaxID=31175 RepID=UPI003B3A5BD1
MVIESVFLTIVSGDKEIGRIESTLEYSGSKSQCIFKDSMIRGGDFPHGDGTGSKTTTNLMVATSQPSYYGSGLPSTTSADRDVNGSQFFTATVETSWLDGKYIVG